MEKQTSTWRETPWGYEVVDAAMTENGRELVRVQIGYSLGAKYYPWTVSIRVETDVVLFF